MDTTTKNILNQQRPEPTGFKKGRNLYVLQRQWKKEMRG